MVSKCDLIHTRELLGSVLDWPRLIAQCFEGLKPGGWIDCTEPDIHVTSDYVPLKPDPNEQWVELFREVSIKSGMTFEPQTKLKAWLVEAGFVNVNETIIPVAVGTWPAAPEDRNLGFWNQARLAKGMRDFTERRMRNYMDVGLS